MVAHTRRLNAADNLNVYRKNEAPGEMECHSQLAANAEAREQATLTKPYECRNYRFR